MTILYIRHPARASGEHVAAGAVAVCQFALAGDAGQLLQQGAAALASLTDLVTSAHRVVLLLAAADVTLLRVKVPPLAPARLRAALPNLVEDQILGDPADCAIAAGPAQGDGTRTVAVVQRAWLQSLVSSLLAQGARGLSVLPGQLCLPLAAGDVAAALDDDNDGLALTLRLAPYDGMGLSLPSQPLLALQTLRSFAGEAPVTLYVADSVLPLYRELADTVPGITLAGAHWAHWISASKGQTIDLLPALGAGGTKARDWRRWRWPLRLAVLALVVNIVGLNVEWLRMRRDAAGVRLAMLQTFKSVYPNEAPLYPALQMRRNLAAAKLNSGDVAPDEFTAISAAFGEAMAGLPGLDKGVIASLDYRERALTVKLKPDMVTAAATARVKAALAERQLQLTEPTPGTWLIRSGGPATASGNNANGSAS